MDETISAHLLDRYAAVYIRQSTAAQVEQHQGSTAWQLTLAREAANLGWNQDRILILQEGRSASVKNNRPEFERLLYLIEHQQVGIVLIADGTRASRNLVEWAQLIEACLAGGTSLYVNGAVYDPENESHLRRLDHIRSRAVTGTSLITKKLARARHMKVSQGEMRVKLPIGYEHDALGRPAMTSDPRVSASIEQIFELFQKLGTAYRVVQELRRHGVEIPRLGLRRGEGLRWVLPTTDMILSLLHNPAYAGVGTYYRTRSVRVRLRSDIPRPPRRLSNPRDWKVVRHQAHDAYISWEQYLRNQDQLKANQDGGAKAQPRMGKGLLQGLMRCGWCGKSMITEYTRDRRDGRKYSCNATVGRAEGRGCQTVMGSPIEAIVIEALLDALSPSEAVALQRVEAERLQEGRRTLREYARREADLIRQAKEAENTFQQGIHAHLDTTHLTAFGQIWEAALDRLAAHRLAHSPPQLDSGNDVGKTIQGLREFWEDSRLDNMQRSLILRSAIAGVDVLKDEADRSVLILIRWRSGSHTVRTLSDEQYRFQRPTSDKVLDLIRELAPQMQPDRIAKRLNDLGWKTSQGLQFTNQKVVDLMRPNNIPRHKFVRGSDFEKSSFPPEHYALDKLARRLRLPTTAVLAYFPTTTLGNGEFTERLHLFVHYPREVHSSIVPVVLQIRRSLQSDQDIKLFAEGRLTNLQWMKLQSMLENSVAGCGDRLAADVLYWLARHGRSWYSVPLSIAQVNYVRLQIGRWKREGFVTALFRVFEELSGQILPQPHAVITITSGQSIAPVDETLRAEVHRILGQEDKMVH